MKNLHVEDESHHIGVAGYCWGGKHTFLLPRDKAKTSSGRLLIDCGFTAHPSFCGRSAVERGMPWGL